MSEQIVEVVTKPSRKKAQPKKSAKPFCVYLGPSIRGVIQKGAIYPGEKITVLSQLQGTIEKYPQIKYLVTTHESVATDRLKLKTPGNLLFEKNKQLISSL